MNEREVTDNRFNLLVFVKVARLLFPRDRATISCCFGRAATCFVYFNLRNNARFGFCNTPLSLFPLLRQTQPVRDFVRVPTSS